MSAEFIIAEGITTERQAPGARAGISDIRGAGENERRVILGAGGDIGGSILARRLDGAAAGEGELTIGANGRRLSGLENQRIRTRVLKNAAVEDEVGRRTGRSADRTRDAAVEQRIHLQNTPGQHRGAAVGIQAGEGLNAGGRAVLDDGDGAAPIGDKARDDARGARTGGGA